MFISESAKESQPIPDVPNVVDVVKGWIADPKSLGTDVLGVVSDYGPKMLLGLVVLVVGLWIAKRLRSAVNKALVRARLDGMLANFLSNVAHVGAVVFVVISVLGTVGIPTTNFAVIIASAGFAIGFALQGSLGNFASGVMIMVFKPFNPGDFVEGAGHAAVVEDVGIFATVLRTPDNKRIIVPNSALTDASITNYSANSTRRIDLVLGIGYSDDIDHARDVILRVLDEEECVRSEPAPQVAVAELADSSVNFVVRPWVATDDYWPTRFALLEAFKKAFDAEGISIPFPQQDVHMFPVPAASSSEAPRMSA